jgi:energy-converting hydrogenase B subunit D
VNWWLDGLLIVALLVTAVAVLLSRDLFRAVVMFMAFGLLMAVAWVRLQAPDIALAEVAIGAGLTGVLLLDAVSHFRRGKIPQQPTEGE